MGRAFVAKKANTYVRLTDYTPEFYEILKRFCLKNLARWQKVPSGHGGTQMKITHVFATFSNDKKELRLCKTFYNELKNYLIKFQFIKSTEEIQEEYLEPYPVEKVQLKYRIPNFKPRDKEQYEYVDFMSNRDNPLTVCNVRTGGGKTVMAIITAVLLGERVILTALPRFNSIWIKAFNQFLKLRAGDVLDLGNFVLEDAVEKIKSGKYNPKIIILPLTKIDVQLKKMKENPDAMHMDDVYRELKCGTRIIDEAHESIYSVYMTMMYGNFNKTIPLSATLMGDDDFVNKVYQSLFPPSAYLKPPVYDKYVHVIAYSHRLDQQKHRLRTEGFGGYSHVLYESGILRRRDIFEKYYKVCKTAFDTYYMDALRPGQKAMWFFATINFCNKFNERLLKDYKDLDTIVFTSEISKKKGMEMSYAEHQVVITTPGSCGTGKDLPKLYIVFACVAVSSTQRNDQMQGRTRPIDQWWPDLDPIFLYFVCPDIPKQMVYHRKRQQVLEKKTKKFSYIDSGIWV